MGFVTGLQVRLWEYAPAFTDVTGFGQMNKNVGEGLVGIKIPAPARTLN
jgi:hypothetical protein